MSDRHAAAACLHLPSDPAALIHLCPRITLPHSVGWFVRIRKLIKGNWSPWCGGMMIGQTHVLTAAHVRVCGQGGAVGRAELLR